MRVLYITIALSFDWAAGWFLWTYGLLGLMELLLGFGIVASAALVIGDMKGET